jgi:hypothetical protein
MKKKILGGIAVLAVAAVAAVNVNFNSQKSGLSDVLLSNVEALANDEDDGISRPCPYNGGTCNIEVGSHFMIIDGYHK